MEAIIARQFVRPAAVFIGVAIVVWIIIVAIGSLLLALHDPHATSELRRPELYVALGLALAVLIGGAILANLPAHELGPLDEPIAIGSTDFYAPVPAAPGFDETVRRGPQGTIADVGEGFTLYASSGPLARVLAVLPGEEEYGRRRRGFLYATGLHGANAELWIPVEAVFAVFPESQSAFLAVKGDEIEHFGWNLPPQSFRRDRSPHERPSSF
jgi:hypothetical protein